MCAHTNLLNTARQCVFTCHCKRNAAFSEARHSSTGWNRASRCSGRSRRRDIPRGEEIKLDKSGEKRKSVRSEISD